MNPLNNADDLSELIKECVSKSGAKIEVSNQFQKAKIHLKIEMSNNDLIDSNIPITLYYSIPRIGYI